MPEPTVDRKPCFDVPKRKDEDFILDYPSKPSGWAMFRAIGSPRYSLAPMVAGSDLPFRMLVREHGCQLCFSPMYHARVFTESAACRDSMHQTNGNDTPLIVQLAGHDPKVVLEAAQLVEKDCAAVDLNLGCPQGIARKGVYGAYLATNWPAVYEVVNTLHRKLSIPVTCKIRLQHDDEDPMKPDVPRTLAYVRMLLDAGCQMLTVHARTTAMKGQGAPYYDVVAKIAQEINGKVPLVVNGAVDSVEKAALVMEQIGAVAVMAGVPILANPGVFNPKMQNPDLADLKDMCRRYISITDSLDNVDDKSKRKLIRAHVMRMMKGRVTSESMQNLAEFRDSADLVARLGAVVAAKDEHTPAGPKGSGDQRDSSEALSPSNTE
ncbi:tRNA-dihydrouridine synthase [Carpediemonas membranifera]|uniref:tRNA-dihydrouridine synthase n=1 Tax=Carpediemonas membranifera TaxID=201153 RepID=A0A8J6E0S5_9EUKA|nr:tRNA-dihydrouridine synthase [Carpediemonas membranifera]|eukprot:KAG9392588.1 tRNA-dihydrouridine synthase [Carpediemonas membranifera]